ncbi:thioredoxin domain-containing protein [Conexibacter sp. JD483]|uniref:DsbA family protein n=1 Tax=unclassified Conexibacter TaxID=2627773 RepID=UPI002723261A|nr:MULTISPECIES: thioredoxin domain-containing protein [unclassified Conexibacter]MDO8184833.1 thioredoxin domain-containing protein [Conexibacter sp. CPCC 205706]MDO8196608.1 thioredoxin domain-containing protein [Conexibacter sp. CPCC 205762]MDR9368679.1 thioredoxin domain-containing protein [Conexibacter sp. JD483]
MAAAAPLDTTTPLEQAIAGLPQRGPWLGKPDAPVVMEVYSDLQCPYCRDFEAETLPRVVRRWVADGTLRIRQRFLTFIGRDSVRTARLAVAAGEQNLLWPTTARLLDAQGEEASGYATDDFLAAIAAAIPGLDADAALARARADATLDPLRLARRSSRQLGVSGTPALAIGRRGTPLRRFDGNPARLREISAAIATALKPAR